MEGVSFSGGISRAAFYPSVQRERALRNKSMKMRAGQWRHRQSEVSSTRIGRNWDVIRVAAPVSSSGTVPTVHVFLIDDGKGHSTFPLPKRFGQRDYRPL
jgi:hypothetical protein